MASHAAHKSTGWAAGIIAAATLAQAGMSAPWCALAFVTANLGATAPDWLELAWWRRGRGRHTWIAHRSWTHWGLAWFALVAYAYYGMAEQPWLSQALAFGIGGVIHLIADAPNPLGVPWLWGSRRMSLHLWNSGRADILVTAPIWLSAAVVADKTWSQGAFTYLASSFVEQTAWPAFVEGFSYCVHWSVAACVTMLSRFA
jgi:membrane-bound metal-dependent hydrolase YbcI (DUF457 family)